MKHYHHIQNHTAKKHALQGLGYNMRSFNVSSLIVILNSYIVSCSIAFTATINFHSKESGSEHKENSRRNSRKKQRERESEREGEREYS